MPNDSLEKNKAGKRGKIAGVRWDCNFKQGGEEMPH